MTRTGVLNTYYRCRLHAKKSWEPLFKAEDRQRRKNSGKPQACPCLICIARYENNDIVFIKRTSDKSHNHGLEAITKLSSAVRKIGAEEYIKRYGASTVLQNLNNTRNGNIKALEAAGASHMTTNDIRNAAAARNVSYIDTRKQNANKDLLEQKDSKIISKSVKR